MKLPKEYRNRYKELGRRLDYYVFQIQKIFDLYNEEAARIVLTTDYSYAAYGTFRFKDFPTTIPSAERLFDNFAKDTFQHIVTNAHKEWLLSESVQDSLITYVYSLFGKMDGLHIIPSNSNALQSFITRKRNGLNLSDRVWNLTKTYKESLETAITTAIEKGTSAITLSKKLSQYLSDFDSLKADYTSTFGGAATIEDCEYRSARLARSEINIAYRSAEYERWQQMDYVLGFDVVLSNNHNCKGIPTGQFHDICDTLQGRYPKDFKFTGWHPNCRCHTEPVMLSTNDMIDYLNSDTDGRKRIVDSQKVTDMPKQFHKWVSDNSKRISFADKRGKLPYFLSDNKDKYTQTPTKHGGNSDGPSRILKPSTPVNFDELIKGTPMTFEQADSGNVNPHFSNKDKANGFGNNCQVCVPTFVARLNGYDVRAAKRIAYDPNNIPNKLSSNVFSAWIDPQTNKSPHARLIGVKAKPSETFNILNSELSQTGIYQISFQYKSLTQYNNEGHTLLAINNGEKKFVYDAQTNIIYKIKDFLKMVDTNFGINILNLEGLALNKEFVNGMFTLDR
ncbi:MAG: toxin glutamine deamidase domain-containing protein [Paludibacteraceae bacterium]|nr:toxin glutamine deamidase domain-containing protein [Paludibacteraceae bacterium]